MERVGGKRLSVLRRSAATGKSGDTSVVAAPLREVPVRKQGTGYR